jgi:hypothetical protein
MADPDRGLVEEITRRMMATAVAPPPVLDLGLPPQMPSGPLNPTWLSVLGSIADGASTAHFLSRGGREDNPLYRGLRGKPWATGLAVAGTGLGELAIARVLEKTWPKLGRVLTSMHAAERIGLAGENVSRPRGSSSAAYRDAVLRAMRKDD